jgi:VWFA-related protein
MLRNFLRQLSALLGLFAMLSGQNLILAQQISDAQVPPPTIRVTTHMVVVDVVVTDKEGKPVTDLKAQDFKIEENGKSQKIAVFSAPGERTAPSAAPLLPGIYSNRPEYRTPPQSVSVILLDAVNTSFKDQAYARSQMLKYLKQQFQPNQRMAIFTLTDSLRELQDFTSDPHILQAALEKYTPQEQKLAKAASPDLPNTMPPPQILSGKAEAAVVYSSPLTPANSTIVASYGLQQFQNAQGSYVHDRRVEITLNAMDTIARALAGLPGPKSVVWLTGSFPFTLIPQNRNVSGEELADVLPGMDQERLGARAAGTVAATERQSYSGEIQQTSTRLASAQVAIYPVDVRGLASGMEANMDDLASFQPLHPSDVAQARAVQLSDTQGTMREIARETGGQAFINQNEIKDSVALVLQSAGSSYTLGYYPSDRKWDGKYRRISIKVDRDKLSLRHRTGYFAIDPSQFKGRDSDRVLAAALVQSVPATLVAFSARVKAPAENKGKLGVDFLVDANTFSAEDAKGGKKIDVSFYAALFSSSGKMLKNASMRANQTLSDGDYQQVMQRGMLLHMDLDPQKDAKDLRLGVRDNRTGYVGTIDAPLGTQ